MYVNLLTFVMGREAGMTMRYVKTSSWPLCKARSCTEAIAGVSMHSPDPSRQKQCPFVSHEK